MPRRVDGHIRQQISTTNAIGVISDIIAKDLSNEQIAKKWGINHQTVKHLMNVYDKPIPKKIANRIYTLYNSIIPSIERTYA